MFGSKTFLLTVAIGLLAALTYSFNLKSNKPPQTPWRRTENHRYLCVAELKFSDPTRQGCPNAQFFKKLQIPSIGAGEVPCAPWENCIHNCSFNSTIKCKREWAEWLIGPALAGWQPSHNLVPYAFASIPYSAWSAPGIPFPPMPMYLNTSCPFDNQSGARPLLRYSPGDTEYGGEYIHEIQESASNEATLVFGLLQENRVCDIMADGSNNPDRCNVLQNEINDSRTAVSTVMGWSQQSGNFLSGLLDPTQEVDDGHSFGLANLFNNVGFDTCNIQSLSSAQQKPLMLGSDNSAWLYNRTQLRPLNTNMLMFGSYSLYPFQSARIWMSNKELDFNIMVIPYGTTHEYMAPGLFTMLYLWPTQGLSTDWIPAPIKMANTSALMQNSLQLLLQYKTAALGCGLLNNENMCLELEWETAYNSQYYFNPNGTGYHLNFEYYRKPGGNAHDTLLELIDTMEAHEVGAQSSSSSIVPVLSFLENSAAVTGYDPSLLFWTQQPTSQQLARARWNARVYVPN